MEIETLAQRIDEEQNAKLNEFAAGECRSWEDKEWSLWLRTDDGATWYTVLDDCGLPSDDNIIEGATGTLMYLDRDDACAQWGGNIGLVSVNNGLSYRPVSELTDDEIDRVIADLPADSVNYPEISALQDDLYTEFFDTNREWLAAFMDRLCLEYIIG